MYKLLNASKKKMMLVINILLLVSFACAVPWLERQAKPVSGGEAMTAVAVEDLPPAVVELDPPAGSELGLSSPVTFIFNQPMVRKTVETAISAKPELSGSFEWVDDYILIYTPEEPWQPENEVSFTIGEGAKAKNGLTLDSPQQISYLTSGFLEITQKLPEAGTQTVDPSSAIVASFNQPVIPLGADPSQLTPAFSIQPRTEGYGEWLNTSTYIFYPDPGLNGGAEYTIKLATDLRSSAEAPLRGDEGWSFTTAMPEVVSSSPADLTTDIPLDAAVTVEFNTPMDTESVESHFAVMQGSKKVEGDFSWDQNDTQMTFTPSELLQRGMEYSFEVASAAAARGGTTLGSDIIATFEAFDHIEILNEGDEIGPVEASFYKPLKLTLNTKVVNPDLKQLIQFDPPAVFDLYQDYDRDIIIYGYFDSESNYTMTVSGEMEDAWGQTMGEERTFTVRIAAFDPRLNIPTYIGKGAMYVDPDDPVYQAQVVNVREAKMAVGSISLEEYFRLQRNEAWDERQAYYPENTRLWSASIKPSRNLNQVVRLPLTPNGGTLSPGIYWVRIDGGTSSVSFALVSHKHLLFKLSAVDALVWAVDREDGSPVVGETVTLYDPNGQQFASGVTDEQGLFHAEFEALEDSYNNYFAVLGTPGQANFSIAPSDWDSGITSWDFHYSNDYRPPRPKIYLYTDRPIYRPGDTLNFRLVAWQAYNGRYSQLDQNTLPVRIVGDYSGELGTFDVRLSSFGTANGSFTLPHNTVPGYYYLAVGEENRESIRFQVAEYRKPEIDLQMEFKQEQVVAGDDLVGQLSARYFFDAPAGNVDVGWSLYSKPGWFSLPGYSVGPWDVSWLNWSDYDMTSELGSFEQAGDGRTNNQGEFALTLPGSYPKQTMLYTLELTTMDESGYPVSTRAGVTVHPASFYIGLRSDEWLGKAGEKSGFDVQVVDWDKNPAGSRSLQAVFSRVEWQRSAISMMGYHSYEPILTEVERKEFSSDERGQSKLSFIPPDPGTYQLEVSGGGAVTQMLLWVGGQGQAAWPELDDNQLHLIADQDNYLPGDTANVFIPNPLGDDTKALISIERGEVLSYQILPISGSGIDLPIPLNDDSAPNLYLSVTLIGLEDSGELGFRHGLLNLPVEPQAMQLQVEVIGKPARATAGEQVKFTVRVTDADGKPVQGEFSLSVVDKAVLALVDPFEIDILSTFYGDQELGVRTSVAFTATAKQFEEELGGLGGGGGGDEPPDIRQDFKDTAFWNGEIITGADGTAQVTVTMPDNLTSWRVQARGVTAAAQVGEAESEVITSKPLLIRTVTPNFMLVGDHLQIGAVVHNNSSSPLEVGVAIQTKGFGLDDPSTAIQQVTIAANSRQRLSWWGTVEDVESVELIFAANSGELGDATRPQNGLIDVKRYLATQTFATAGVLDESGERLELVSLPHSFDPGSGGLQIDLASSLAAAMLPALETLEDYPYETTEGTVSRFLPNLMAYQALQEFNVEAPALKAELERNLEQGINKLRVEQSYTGGWGWTKNGNSNPYISAYALLGLTTAKQAGFSVDQFPIDWAVEYLQGSLATDFSGDNLKEWELDRVVFIHYALRQAGVETTLDPALLQQHQQLNPWAQALLALIDADNKQTLLSDLQSSAIRSATGAHWELTADDHANMSTAIFNTSVVVYVLAQEQPNAPLLADAVRYLMAHRDVFGAWSSNYATSWSVMALTQVMRATGELGGEFNFSASLNGQTLAEGSSSGNAQVMPVSAQAEMASLNPDLPNALRISRLAGSGRLYYSAVLSVSQPVTEVAPLQRGLAVSRAYYDPQQDCSQSSCTPVSGAIAGELVTARITLTLPHDMYYLTVEDNLPAGSEVLDTSLKSSQQGAEPVYDPWHPFKDGWGWWYFNRPVIYQDHIVWMADFLPAGCYEFVYTLVAMQPGEYQVMPVRAFQMYFPEVQGHGAGSIFTIGEQ